MAETALVIIEEVKPVDVFANNGLDPLLGKLKTLAYKEIEGATVDTARGRKVYAAAAYKVARTKTGLDAAGKSLVEKQKQELKKIDAERKRFRDFCESLQSEIRQPLTDWEKAEEERVARELAEAAFIQDWVDAHAEHDLYLRQKAIEAKEAEYARIEAEKKAKEETERVEAERIERERRLVKEAEERVIREAKEAVEKAEREHAAFIERAKAEAEKAEERRIEAEKRAKEDQAEAVRVAQEAERRRIEQEQRTQAAKEAVEKAEAEKKAANKTHQAQVNRTAKDALITEAGLTGGQAEAVIIAIAKGKIPRIAINY
jgi:colicin import membrane protein